MASTSQKFIVAAVRIAIVTNNFPAISETFISNKVLQLAAKKHALFVFCSFFNKPLWNKINHTNYKINVVEINRKKITKYFFSHPALWIAFLKMHSNKTRFILNNFFINEVNKKKPDIIHFEFSGIGLHYIDALEKIKCKKIVSCRGSAEKVKLLSDELRKEKTKQLFNAVDAIHCVSDDMKQTILPYCNQPQKIFINYPAVDTAVFQRSHPYITHHPINILSVGRFTFQKGYLSGLLAIKKLKETQQNFQWLIVGDGNQKEEIIFHINQMNLQQQVQLVGTKSRSEIIELYNQSDIFFLPSVYEGIANVALEAMSMELPVIATRSGGMKEVIAHKINGMLANVYNHETLAANLLQLFNDKALRISLGKNARKRVLEQFTAEAQIKKFEAVYSALI
ncbi:MAG: glycosyltransferase family 4 protein [Chitinophagaceae bacterium]